MKNVTVTLEEEVAQWARVWAAQHNRSLSRMLGELLADQMRAEHGYQTAMQSFLARKPRRLRSKLAAYPRRDTLHDRQNLRR